MLIDTAHVYNDPSKLYDKQKKKIWKKDWAFANYFILNSFLQ